MARYTELFSILYKHEYFSQAGSFDMTCCLTHNTARLFNNMEIIIRTFEGGCRIFYDEDCFKSASELFALFPGENISFLLFPVDKYDFYNYTSGFSADNDGLVLFTVNDLSVIDGSSVDLGFGEFTPFVSPGYYRDHDSAEMQNNNSELEPDKVNTFTPDEINEIRTRAKLQLPVMFKVTTHQLKAFPEAAKFIINFKSTETYYKYYLSPEFESKTLHLQDMDNNIQFTRGQEVLDNGMKMQVFVSTTPIKSHYKLKLNFRMFENNTGSKIIIINNMPMPKPGSYFTHQVNDATVMVSEIFIN
jgi:hypothetical protein